VPPCWFPVQVPSSGLVLPQRRPSKAGGVNLRTSAAIRLFAVGLSSAPKVVFGGAGLLRWDSTFIRPATPAGEFGLVSAPRRSPCR
jgi:hypothetical protein